jgi:cation diffusion facilitator CzcD-associated flavoprotein CzcO
MPGKRDPAVVIVGGGFGGIAAAIELRRHGFRDVTILERAPELGGTWHYNTYPGAACDVPSHLYSFSFAQRRDWSRLCSPQEEILAYLQAVAREHGVDELVVTDTEVASCEWRERWLVTSTDGRTWEADAVVLATGQLDRPVVPAAAAGFAGKSFHSARWDHEYDMRGKRVAVIGTGASAVQFVPPLAEQAAQVVVFQRTPNWFLPRRNRRYPAPWRALLRWLPGLQLWRRLVIFEYAEFVTLMIRHPRTWGRLGRLWSWLFMRRQLRDREVRRQAMPRYTFGCKRVLFSSAYLPALQRPNVRLVTEPITRVEAGGPVTADGELHEVDCLVYATGFSATRLVWPIEVTGQGGRSLSEAWAEGAHAHLGMAVPGFPSMFVLYGPNTNTSGGSIIYYLETQAAYVRQALEHVRHSGAAAVEVREDVEALSDRALQERFAGTAWLECDSWYRNESGRIVTNWPGYMREYRAAAARFDPAQYVLLG